MTETVPTGLAESADKPHTQETLTPILDGAIRVDCTVLIVTYNSAEHIVPLLNSLPAAAGDGDFTLRTLVVDNGSVDETTELVRSAEVACIETGANLGYADAINVGREHAGKHSALVILDPDIALEPHAIERLHATVVRAGVAASVSRLLDTATVLHPRRAGNRPCCGR